MPRTPPDRDRNGRKEYVPALQNDVDDYDDEDKEIYATRPGDVGGLTSRFRNMLEQNNISAPQNQNLLSSHTSPALSDTTLVAGDYLDDQPSQNFEDVDISDCFDQFGYYGQEILGDDGGLSYSPSLKDGKGIQVRVEDYPYPISPGGLHLADQQPGGLQYEGSEGSIQEKLPPHDPSDTRYRPIPLRWWFLSALVGALVVFFALTELSLHLLPDASAQTGNMTAPRNISEIRARSNLDFEDMDVLRLFEKRHGAEEDSSSSAAESTTATDSQAVAATSSPSAQQPTSTSQSPMNDKPTTTPTIITPTSTETTTSAAPPATTTPAAHTTTTTSSPTTTATTETTPAEIQSPSTTTTTTQASHQVDTSTTPNTTSDDTPTAAPPTTDHTNPQHQNTEPTSTLTPAQTTTQPTTQPTKAQITTAQTTIAQTTTPEPTAPQTTAAPTTTAPTTAAQTTAAETTAAETTAAETTAAETTAAETTTPVETTHHEQPSKTDQQPTTTSSVDSSSSPTSEPGEFSGHSQTQDGSDSQTPSSSPKTTGETSPAQGASPTSTLHSSSSSSSSSSNLLDILPTTTLPIGKPVTMPKSSSMTNQATETQTTTRPNGIASTTESNPNTSQTTDVSSPLTSQNSETIADQPTSPTEGPTSTHTAGVDPTTTSPIGSSIGTEQATSTQQPTTAQQPTTTQGPTTAQEPTSTQLPTSKTTTSIGLPTSVELPTSIGAIQVPSSTTETPATPFQTEKAPTSVLSTQKLVTNSDRPATDTPSVDTQRVTQTTPVGTQQVTQTTPVDTSQITHTNPIGTQQVIQTTPIETQQTTQTRSDYVHQVSQTTSAQSVVTSSAGGAPTTTSPISIDNTPFTTIVITSNTEPPSPVTSVITTSSTVSSGTIVQVIKTTSTIIGLIKGLDPITTVTQPVTDINGEVQNMTITALYSTVTSTYYNSNGKPTKTQVVAVLRSAQQTTLDDGYGYPTATENYYEVQSLSTIYSDKVPVSTETISIPEVLTTSYLTNSDGKTTETSVFLVPLATEIKAFSNAPTPTASASPNTTSQSVTLQRLPDGLYFSGIMLPTIVAILISIPIRVLYHNVSLYQGFHALASDGPARAADSLCLKTTGPGSIVASFRSLQTRHYLLGLTGVIAFFSVLIIPFSTEAFRPVLSGSDCINGSSDQMTCSVNIGIYPVTAQIVAAFLVLLIVGMAFVAFKLWRWDTGVSRNPWNMTFMADLGGTELQRILGRWRRSNHKIENEELRKFLGGNIFELGLWELNGIRRYGVLVYTGHGVDNSEKLGIIRCCWPKGSDFLPFFMLSITGRVLLLLLLGAVLVVVLIYDTVAQGSEYQRGLTGKAIGVRFLFSGFGVLATIAWGSFFSSVAFMSPYRLLNRRRIFTAHAKYVCPPTNPFSGVWLAFVKSRRDIYLGIVSGTAILSEFLPLFLGNIPSNNIEAESAQTVCVWLSVSIVSLMALTVAGSFFVKWPEMDIDPSTIIGAMYVAIEPNVKRFINRAERV